MGLYPWPSVWFASSDESSCRPTFYPVFLLPLFRGLPAVAVSALVGPLCAVDVLPGSVVYPLPGAVALLLGAVA